MTSKLEMLELKIYPEPCLRIKTNPVENFEADLSETLRATADIMYVNNGIGLAATQVGIGTRFLMIDIGEGLMTFINPEISERSNQKSRMEEGCLSLPGIAVSVPRSKKITVRAQDQNGKFFVKRYDGLMATAIQHEIDHLNGKLIIDYMNPFKYFMAVRKLSINKRKMQSKKPKE